MAEFLHAVWQGNPAALSRADRADFTIHPYLPDTLQDRGWQISAENNEKAALVEKLLLKNQSLALGLDALSRFLLRRDAVSSSQIEGLQVNSKQLALAELSLPDPAPAANRVAAPNRPLSNAQLVARNIAQMDRAVRQLAAQDTITPQDLVQLQAQVVEPAWAGVRDQQNWVGGAATSPRGAEFVPPPPQFLPDLLQDLASFSSGASLSGLIQAGIAHAQFETIHPFPDGNGRVGRTLVHAILARRYPTVSGSLPISVALQARSGEYVHGLQVFRYEGPFGSLAQVAGLNEWLAVFLSAAEVACEKRAQFATALAQLRTDWMERFEQWRQSQGKVKALRSDSAQYRLLDEGLMRLPALGVQQATALLDLSPGAVRSALKQLSDAGVLSEFRFRGNVQAYYSREIFELLTLQERDLASSQYDARISPPPRGLAPNN